MPSNPWLALGAGDSPVERARDARRIWDEFLAEGRPDGARAPIAASWLRSQTAGVDPGGTRAPTLLGDRREVAELLASHRLGCELPVIVRWLGRLAEDSEHLIVVSDADGLLLRVEGDPRIRSAAADAMNFVEGTLWSEDGAGTNAVGTAVAADHPIQVHAAEHFLEVVHGWTCSAAPVHDPEDGSLLGIVDLTGLAPTASADTAAAVLATARAVEADLRVQMQLRDARLRLRHVDGLATSRGRVALVSGSGRVIADDPEGLVGADRIALPPAAGVVELPGGRRAAAEPVAGEDAFLLHELDATRRRRPGGLGEWRRAQEELSRLAAEQAALRRVATLVAGRTTPDEIFQAVTEEVGLLLSADRAAVVRYEADGEWTTVVSVWRGDGSTGRGAGARFSLAGDSVTARVLSSGRPQRLDDYVDVEGAIVDAWVDETGVVPRSTIAAPIVVEGRVWGALIVLSAGPGTFPDAAESRLLAFAELAETAISNAVGRADLEASRARVVAAGDEARRRLERDLHDGAQQRLVSLALRLREAEADLPDELAAVLRAAADEATATLDELRRFSQGIHPTVLTRRGLVAAIRELARRSPVPVELDLATAERYPEPVEIAAYYVVSEAVTNAAKHAGAESVRVSLAEADGLLRVAIEDDGVGGADAAGGSGLLGLRDRVEAADGTLVVDSPAGGGTTVLAALPLS